MNIDSPVAIIGLGLMGGSLARDLAGQGTRVIGSDRQGAVVEEALQSGIIERALPPDLVGLDDARLVVVATPVDAAAAALPTIALRSHPDAVVTDVGSTKRDILRAASQAGIGRRFAGSHPLAGDHRSGWNATRTHLYEGATVFVCPGDETDPAALEEVTRLWESVDARPVRQDPAEHDRVMSIVSHLPQVLATALAAVMTREGVTWSDLGPGGRDMTRLADSSTEMWSAIALANADNLANALGPLQDILTALRQQLTDGDRDRLRDFFDAGKKLRG